MSTFAVTIERISEVMPHPNADRLELARVSSMSYQFVIAKGEFHVDDLVVYFPIDSILPNPLIALLGLEGKLSGPEKNRIKTVRLRGQISQGIVAKMSILPFSERLFGKEGDSVTAALSVSKYEAPVIPSSAGNLVPLPRLVSVYDIEGAEKYEAQLNQMMHVTAYITEKVEGSHFAISYYSDGATVVSQRRYAIEPIEGKKHDWIKAAESEGLFEKIRALFGEISSLMSDTGSPLEVVTLRGEIVGPGIQGNYYQLPSHRIYAFEIEANGKPVEANWFTLLCDDFDIRRVPQLSHGSIPLRLWLDGKSIAEASNGRSQINPSVIREGIVVRPLQLELNEEGLGRMILKQRSPVYLAATDY